MRVLEDDPTFNAGRGAVFTHEGSNELDASIMDGATGQAGAVAGVRTGPTEVSEAIGLMTPADNISLGIEARA